MRILIRPMLDPRREVDVTERLVSVIAEELWLRFGGNGQLNWIEAEIHLENLVGGSRTGTMEPRKTRVPRGESEDWREGEGEGEGARVGGATGAPHAQAWATPGAVGERRPRRRSRDGKTRGRGHTSKATRRATKHAAPAPR